MDTKRLEQYISTHRLKAGLTQVELAKLLGLKSRASVSRYECGRQTPRLETLVAIEIICQRPLGTIYAGLRDRVLQRLQVEASRMVESDANAETTVRLEAKLMTLASIINYTSGDNESES